MAARRRKPRRSSGTRKWSARVTRTCDALDLQGGAFKQASAREIAVSLKHSAERSRRRKSPPLRSAMWMLTFCINRAGKNLPARRLRTLKDAKDELRKLFKKPPKKTAA